MKVRTKRGACSAIRRARPVHGMTLSSKGVTCLSATPSYKQARATTSGRVTWIETDFERIASDHVPSCSYGRLAPDYDARYPAWTIGGARISSRKFPRVAWRRMADNIMERTLIAALVPPGAAHVHTVYSVALPHETRLLLELLGAMNSLLADFVIRSVPKADIHPAGIARLPRFTSAHLSDHLIHRVARLNCIASAYDSVWAEAHQLITDEPVWTGGLDFPGRAPLADVPASWQSEVPLRRATDRRQAQIEIDALFALDLGVSIDDLCTIYRTQFPVLFNYDRSAYTYDVNGRELPQSVLSVWRKKGDAISEEERTATNPSGNTYVYELPFVTLDREADMRQAYAHFEKVLAEKTGSDSGEKS